MTLPQNVLEEIEKIVQTSEEYIRPQMGFSLPHAFQNIATLAYEEGRKDGILSFKDEFVKEMELKINPPTL